MTWEKPDTEAQLTAKYHAYRIAECGTIAHYSRDQGQFEHHCAEQIEALRLCCEALGYDMVKK